MEHIILGLLMLQSMTIYQLRKRINSGLNLMYSCSTGSIQAAIKKLLKCGYVAVEEIVEGGKLKKLYSITEAGEDYFNLWVNSPVDSGAPKYPELTKVYFMGLSEKDNRAKLIESRIADLRKSYAELTAICKEGERLSSEAHANEVLYYQLQTARYGRDFVKFNIEWYNKLLKDIGDR